MACSKLVQNHVRKEMNKAPIVPNVATSNRRNAMRVQNPTVAFTFRCRNVATLAHPYVAMLRVFDSNVMSSHVMSHRNIEKLRRWRCWKFMSNVTTLDTNVMTLLGFPTMGKLQKSNIWDFYSLPSCSFFILTILNHLTTIYIKNNTGFKPFHTKKLIFKTFENIGTKNRNSQQ